MTRGDDRHRATARRRAAWAVLLTACAWIAWNAPDPEPAASMAPRSPATTPALQRPPGAGVPGTAALDPPATLVPRDTLVPATAGSVAAGQDPFGARDWRPPAPPPPAVVAPPPAAPPLPYTWLGQKLEGEAWEVYLARGDRTLIVRAGQVIDGEYRVDRVQPPSLTLTYLPLAQPQTLAIGEAR